MTNTEKIIARSIEIGNAMLEGKDLQEALYDFSLLTSQGSYSHETNIKRNRYTQDALDFIEANDNINDEFLFLHYDKAVYNEAEDLEVNPEAYGYSKEDIADMDEDERFETVAHDFANFVLPGFLSFVAICVQVALDEQK